KQRVRILGLDRKRRVIACQRLLTAPKPLEDNPVVQERSRGSRISLQGGGDQFERFERPALLVSNDPEQMGRVEMSRLCLPNLRIQALGVGQSTILVKDGGLVEQLPQIKVPCCPRPRSSIHACEFALLKFRVAGVRRSEEFPEIH